MRHSALTKEEAKGSRYSRLCGDDGFLMVLFVFTKVFTLGAGTAAFFFFLSLP